MCPGRGQFVRQDNDNKMSDASGRTGPLTDIRLVELGQLIAGPFCGQLMADMGADVIKVEPPGQGDPMRACALPGALDGLRKYSQADFLRNHLDLQLLLDPMDDLGVTLTSAFSLTDYDDSVQGVTDDDRFDVGIEATYQLHERVGMSAHYTYDYLKLFQKQGGGTWDSETRDTAHNAGLAFDVIILRELLDGEISYFIQSAEAKTSGGGTAVDFPDIEDMLQAFTFALSVHPLEFLTIRGVYRWEKYDRENFHEDFPQFTNSTGDIYLQNAVGDYLAHIFSVSAIFEF